MFEKKYDSMLKLLNRFNSTGEEILKNMDIQDYVESSFDISESEFDEIHREFHKLGSAWGEAKLLVESESEDVIRRGLFVLEMVVKRIAEVEGYSVPYGTFRYDGSVEFDSYDEFTEITQASQDAIRDEIKRPVDQFREV